MSVPPLRHQQLAVRCPWCKAAPNDPCTIGRQHTHDARRTAWVIAAVACPTCGAQREASCHDFNRRPFEGVHPARDAEAVRTQPPARRPRIERLGEQQHIEITDTEES